MMKVKSKAFQIWGMGVSWMFFPTAIRECDDPGVAFATSGTWYARSREAQGARLRRLRSMTTSRPLTFLSNT